MKRGLYLLPLILIAILSLNVLALDVTFTPVQDQVLPGQQAKYVLHVINNEQSRTDVTIRSIDLSWVLENDGAKYFLNPGESLDFNAVYTPISDSMKPGRYGANYMIVSGSKTKVNDYLPITILSYDEVLDASFAPDSVIDTKHSSIVKLEINNLKPIDLVGLQLNLEGDAITDTRTISLDKNEKNVVEYQVSPNPKLHDGNSTVMVTISIDGHNFISKPLNVMVGQYTNLQQTVEPISGFLIMGEVSTLKNNGNNEIDQDFKEKLSSVQKMFTSFSPQPTYFEDGADGYKYAVWSYKLMPGQSQTFSYKTNYLAPLFYALIFVVVIGGAYYFLKRDLEVTKKVLSLHTTEGNLAIMKVLITVKNKSSAVIKDVKVLDKVPGAIRAPVEFGMIKPNSVKNVGEHTALVWDLPHLKSGEEKVISYKIEGRVSILDTIVLPHAMAKFGLGTGKKVFISNSASLKKRN